MGRSRGRHKVFRKQMQAVECVCVGCIHVVVYVMFECINCDVYVKGEVYVLWYMCDVCMKGVYCCVVCAVRCVCIVCVICVSMLCVCLCSV